MKLFALLLSTLLTLPTLTESLYFQSNSGQDLSEVQLKFQEFRAVYGKNYPSLQEYLYRLQIFQQNLEMFQAHNSDPKSTYTMGITPFADMKPEEAYSMLGLEPIDIESLKGAQSLNLPEAKLDFVETLDWSALGLVPAVVDTQDSKVGTKYMITYAIDSCKSLKDETLISDNYSVQELIDCTQDLQAALEFTKSKGLETETDYKSKEGTDSCGYDPHRHSLNVKEWDILKVQESSIVTQMEINLQKQPLVTLMNAQSGNFLYYTGGIIDVGCPTQIVINHALLLVGYDINENYWKMQNSWGTKWGEGGYVRIKRGEDICGIEQFVFSPQLY